MKCKLIILLGLVAAATAGPCLALSPIALNPENPHYFLFRGRPVILIGSTEHYGAVLNLDFDYIPYLDELHARGLNLTRTFSGSYREVPDSFGITDNTLAPRPGRYICPWARSSIPGAADGGDKFDLTKWDSNYFVRLKDFVAQAGKRDIVVELVLFCTLYNNALWKVSPLNSANNINDIGSFPRQEVYTLKHARLVAVQDAMVKKILDELKDYDNLYYEVINEPYFGGVSVQWQDHIVQTICKTESGFPARHLIAQNIANGFRQITSQNPAVSIFNFHYSFPPLTVAQNYALDRPIAFDETGFAGSSNAVYRADAWAFFLAGGSAFDNLDYSFTTVHPDGTARQKAPGGGTPALRAQYTILKNFLNSFDFLKMAPKPDIIQGGAIYGPDAHYLWNSSGTIKEVPGGPKAWVLAEDGKAYAIYIDGGSQVNLVIHIPEGLYKAEWINTKSGKAAKATIFRQIGAIKTLRSPLYTDDIALRIRQHRPQ